MPDREAGRWDRSSPTTSHFGRFTSGLSLRVREAGEQVDDATQVVLQTWLLNETSDNKGRAVKRALQIGWWRANALQALATLTADQLAGVTDPPPEMVTRAAQIYSTAVNWDQANALAASVANPFADRFTSADIALVLKASHSGADLRGSHGFREFISLLYDKNPISSLDLETLLDEHHLDVYKRAAQIAED